MSSKFKGLLDAAREEAPEPEPKAELVVNDSVQSQTPAAQVSSKKKGGRGGKRSHPDYEQVSAYIRKETHRAIKLALLEDGGHGDFSDLIEQKLQEWLKKRSDGGK